MFLPVVRGQNFCSVNLVSGVHPQGPRWTATLTIITASISEEIIGKKDTSRELPTLLFTSQWPKLVIYFPPNDTKNVFFPLGDNMSSQWTGRERNVGGTSPSRPQIIITRGNSKANSCRGRLLGNHVSHPPDDSLPPPSLSAQLSSQASGNLQTAKIVSSSKRCALERGVYLAFSALSKCPNYMFRTEITVSVKHWR